MSVKYGSTYYYVTNIQGDVVALLNTSGTAVVEYTYDAWGKLYSTIGTLADTLGEVNLLTYRGYVYDHDTELYYLQSRYYDPEVSRFINADGLVSTGQGLIGNNMFAYCLSNPVNFADRIGKDAEALQWWITRMGWLPFSDTALPISDIIYIGGILLLGAVSLASENDSAPELVYDEVDAAYGPPSPNDDNDDNDDDDEYDNYYDDDSNFGGRQKIGKPKGKTPGNNQAQNKQFKKATKNLDKDQKKALHIEISGEGFGFHDIVDAAKNIWFLFIDLFDVDD